jgi:hypothetical protein
MYTLTVLEHLICWWGEYHISHISTLRNTSGRVQWGSYEIGMGHSVKKIAANGNNVFKISTFGPIRE